MDVDPLASMRCWGLEIELGGRVYDIPALPAVEWWPVIVSGSPSLILDMIESDPSDPLNIDDLLLTGKLSEEDMTTALLDAVEEVAGRTLHASFVLATVATSQWASINGAMARKGFRWEDQPLGAALDALYAEITSRLDKDTLPKFLAMLDNEGLTTGTRRGRSSGRVVSEFESMAGPKPTSGLVATGEQSGSARPKTRTRPRPPRPADPSSAPRPRRAPRAGSGPAART
jgi:hypothetical protein